MIRRVVIILAVAAIMLAAPAWAIKPNPSGNLSGNDVVLYHFDTTTAHPDGVAGHTLWYDDALDYDAMANKAALQPGLFGNAIGSATPLAGWSAETPDLFEIPAGQSFTLESWIYLPSNVNVNLAQQRIAERRTGANCWLFGLEDGKLAFQAWGGPSNPNKLYSPAGLIQNNVWYHVAVTYRHIDVGNNEVKLYITPKPEVCPVDPIEVASATGWGDYPASTSKILMFYGTGATDRFFRGYVDELRYSHAVLTSFESLQPGILPRGATVVWGDTQQFTYDSANTPINWTVDNSSVGQIDSSGLFTPVGPGTCNVTATDSLGNTDTVTVNVPAPIIIPDTATVTTRGTLQFTFSPATPINWTVILAEAGTIDSNGLFTAGTTAGTCTISATDSLGNTDVSGTINIVAAEIYPSPVRVVLGTTANLVYNNAIGNVTWAVQNESGGPGSVGTIDSVTGVFTPIALGTCEVTATDSAGNIDVVPVTVVGPGTYRYETDDYTVGLWHLDESSGTRFDSSGNNFHGYSHTGLPVPYAAGIFGNAMEVLPWNEDPPAGAWLITDATVPRPVTEEMTAEAWIYFPAGKDPAVPETQGIMVQRPGNTWSFVLGPFGNDVNGNPAGVPGGLNFSYWPADGSAPIGTATSQAIGFLNDTWYHVAAVFDKLDTEPVTYEVRLYCTPQGTTTPQLVASQITDKPMKSTGTDRIFIGLEAGSLYRNLSGYIDEVRYSNTVRSVDDLSWTLGKYPAMTALPVITPGGGTYEVPQYVTISCATEGATIHYTTDGSDPDQNSAVYNGEIIPVTQSMTIKARAFKTGYANSGFAIANYTIKDFSRPKAIPYNNAVTVDGNLADWADAEWTPLDQNYDGNPSDIAEAYYAAKWSSDKIYVAARVRDTQPCLTNGWTDWYRRDAVEFYIHTTGTGPVNYNATQADAQQYTMGFNLDGVPFNPTVWSCIKDGQAYPDGAFQGAGTLVVDELGQMWYHYEAAITPYHHFTLDGSDLQVSPLSAGQMIGLDVVAVSNDGTEYNYYNNNPATPGYKGMKAENMLLGKWNDYTMFGQHVLAGQANANIAEAKQKVDGAVVGISGIVSAVFPDCFYIEAENRTYGIRVNKENHGRTVGEAVTVFGKVATYYTSERYITPASISVNGAGEIKPLAMTNKALGGGDFGTPPAGQVGVADGSGLNNIGLLVTVTGRVIAKGADWFMIDDGSGVGVKVKGTVPAGTPYVTVKGICSCEKDSEGNVQRVILETEKLENVP